MLGKAILKMLEVGDKQNLYQHSYHVGWDSDIDINIMYVGLELDSTFCILNGSQRRSSDTFCTVWPQEKFKYQLLSN